MFGDGCAYIVGKSAAGSFTRAPGFKFGERRSDRGVGCLLEVLDGFEGSVGLVGVALGLVPACSEDGGPEVCVDEELWGYVSCAIPIWPIRASMSKSVVVVRFLAARVVMGNRAWATAVRYRGSGP